MSDQNREKEKTGLKKEKKVIGSKSPTNKAVKKA